MRLYIIIGIILSACTSNQSSKQSSDGPSDEIRKMIAEDSFTIDTNMYSSDEGLSELDKISLNQIALKALKPKYDIKDLSIENVLDVYTNLLKTTKKYSDSIELQRKYLDQIFEEIELQNEKLEQSTEYPIEIKLEIASIKSDIHFLRSNRQLKPKQ